MADIRCPMCGKSNSSDLDVCQFCEARLKPLQVSQPSEGDEMGGPDESIGAPDQEGVFPDWLSDLREGEDDMSIKPDAGAEEGMFDDNSTPSEEEPPNWLARLQEQGSFDEDVPSQEPGGPEPVSEEPLPDWLSGADAFVDDETSQEETPVQKEEALPDWLTTETQAGEVELPEEPQILSPEPLPQEPSLEPEDISIEWPSTAESLEEEGLPDVLGETQPETGEVPWSLSEAEEPTDEPLPDDEKDPYWLQKVRARRDADELENEFATTDVDGEDEVDEEAALPAEDVPDWLTALSSQELIPDEEESQPAPDWLSSGEVDGVSISSDEDSAQSEGLAQEPLEEIPSLSVDEGEAPDWLSGIEAESQDGVRVPAFTDTEDIELPPDEGEEDALEWLSQIEADTSETPAGESVPALIFDDVAEEEPEPEPEQEEQVESPVEGEYLASMPAWASSVSADEVTLEDIAEAGDGIGPEIEEPDLAPAELPGWLEAMRPVEAVAPTVPFEDVSDQQEVTAGPLIGLRGVLSAEPGAVQHRKPKAFSIKLQVTAEQQARVALLQEMLASEKEPKPLPSKPVISSQYIFRLVIALVLLLPVLWIVLIGSQSVPLPAQGSVPPEVTDFRQSVTTLSANDPVLLSFDYQPGYLGEMDAAAAAVIQDLVDRDVYLALVSTSTTGPVLAERFIGYLNNQPEYAQDPYTNYANFGYIPGGAIGLLGLAEELRLTIPYTLDSLDVWGNQPLNSITTLADFERVIVLTDDSDTARAWIEQVGPSLDEEDTPLLMVVSAQAEPMVLPYYESNLKQVSGLVSGMAGGAAYESISGISSLARVSWDAFSLGLLVAEVIIIVGVILSISTVALVGDKKDKR
jgi:hypothetical protein